MTAAPAKHDGAARAAPPFPSPKDWHVRQRWSVLGLASAGAALFAASWLLPYWNFRLIAPQYPDGLNLIISLTGVTGDVAEIDTINHYIGMAHIESGAEFERAMGGYLVAGLAIAIMTATLYAGKRLNWLALTFAAALPIGFLADTSYWLYTFGHDLDPRAPIHLAVFTPTLFGAGKVGQFATHAWPAAGFWMVVVGGSLVVIASAMRQRVCNTCPHRAHCEALCDHGIVAMLKVPPAEWIP